MTSRRRTNTSRARPRPQPKPRLGREAKILLLLGAPVVLVAAVVLFVATRSGSSNTDTGSLSGVPTEQQQDILVRDDSPVLGAPDAPVTIVEFLDPECEACRAAFPGIKQLLSEYDGQVRLVVRYFPLHGNSVLAAQATEAAGEQGKYWEMQELLFNNQPQWGEKDTTQTELFVEYARSLGLNVDQFTATLQSGTYVEKINRDRRDGAVLAVQGTPTIFVNGRQVRAVSYAGLKSAVDRALESSK